MPICLMDWKSSKFIGAEMMLQLGAYYGATHYREKNADGLFAGWLPKTADIQPEQAAIIKIGPNYVGLAEREVWKDSKPSYTEKALLTKPMLDTAFAQFQNCLEVFWWLTSKDFVSVPEKEAYKFEDKQLVSVTYVIQHVIAKPALLNWYAKMAKEGKDPNAERDKRGAEGTLWHKNILWYLQGRSVDIDNGPPTLAQTIAKFAKWEQSVKLKPILLETSVAHPELGYGGTLDAIADCNLEG